MAEQTIDRLSIEIDAKAEQASAGIDSIIKNIERLKQGLEGGIGETSGIIKSINMLKEAFSGVAATGTGITKLADGINTLNSTDLGNILKQFKDINKAMEEFKSINAITAPMKDFGAGMGQMAAGVKLLQDANMEVVGDHVKQLKTTLKEFSNIQNVSTPVKQFGSGLVMMISSLKSLDGINIYQIGQDAKQLAIALQGFSGIKSVSTPMKDFGVGISRMVSGFKSLKNIDIEELQYRIEELTAALRPFIEEMAEAGGGVINFGTQMKAFSDSMKSVNNMQVQMGKQTMLSRTGSGGGMFAGIGKMFKAMNLASVVYLMKNVASVVKSATEKVSGYVGKMSDYIENVNLFTISMGEFTQEATEFTDRIQNDLGFDSGEAMRYMGIFQQLSTSFGVSSDKAFILSKNLTQLGLDFASFFNLKTEDAFQKLQSGISGEIEPLRALGIDISNTRLQQELYNLGINRSVESLSQADKETLRYIAIMKQAGNVAGDTARSITSPANALRMLQSQLDITARQIGSIFIPMLNKVIPYLTAFVKIIGDVAARIAAFFGFEMPTFEVPKNDLPAVSEDLEQMGQEAQKTAKKMNFLIGGFDELNRLEAKQDSSSGLGVGNILGDIDLPQYDMFEGLVESDVDAIVDRLTDAFKRLKDTLMDLGLRDVIEKFKSVFNTIRDEFSKYDFAEQIKGVFLNGFKLAMAVIMAGLTTLEPMIAGIAKLSYLFVENLNSFLGTMADRIIELLPKFEELGTVIGDFLLEFAGQIEQYDFGEAFANMIGNGLSAALSILIAAGKLVFPLVVALEVPTLIYEKMQTISQLFATLDSIVQSVTPGLENFVNIGLVPIYEWIGDKIADAFQFLQEQLRKVGDWFTEHTQMFTDLGEKLGELTSKIWSVIEPIADAAWEGFKTVLGKIVDATLDLIKNFVEMVTPIADAAIQFYNWLDSIGVIDNVIGFLKQQIDGVVSVISGIIDTLSGVITYMSGVFSGDWAKRWEGLKQIFKGVWDSLWGIIQMFFGDTAVAIKEWIEEKIFPWFSLEKWKEIGQNLVDGLIEGIGDIWEKIKEKFTGIIDKVKGVFGIQSPSKVFMEIGEYNMEGLNQGMDSKWSDTIKLFSDGITDIESNFDSTWQNVITKSGESLSSLNSTSETQMGNFNTQWGTNWGTAEETIKMQMDLMKQATEATLSEIQALRAAFQSAFQSSWSSGMNDIRKVADSAFSGIKNFASSAFSSIQTLASNMISRVREGINALKDLVSQQNKVQAVGEYAGNISSYNRNNVNSLRPRTARVPALAGGGVIRKPTYALVGEYPGAGNNPEIVAPQSTIEESVVAANGELVGAMLQMTQMMIAAFREGQNVSLQIDGKEVGKASAKYMRDEERRTGKNPGRL